MCVCVCVCVYVYYREDTNNQEPKNTVNKFNLDLAFALEDRDSIFLACTFNEYSLNCFYFILFHFLLLFLYNVNTNHTSSIFLLPFFFLSIFLCLSNY